MATTWYAWSQINAGSGDKVNVIPIGASVSAGDVGGDEALAQLVSIGSLRSEEYPNVMASANPESPVEFFRRKAREATEQMFDPSAMSLGVAMTPALTTQPLPEE